MMKVCSKCGESKELNSDNFGKAKANKDGYKGICKSCIREYRKENREEIAEYNKRYRQENKEKVLEHTKQYNKENREKILEYRKENKEKISEHKKQYYKENKEKVLEHKKQYRKENPHIGRQATQRRRARLRQLPHTLTVAEWEEIKDNFNNECAYCGMSEEEHFELWTEQLHQEHIVPVTKGGGYEYENIIPCCRSCNCSKNDSGFIEWYRVQEFYSIDREYKILEHMDPDKGVELQNVHTV